MLGIRFLKTGPTDYVMQYRNGKVIREGAGLSFFYYAPTTSLVRIPIGSQDAAFIFEEVSADFQQVSVQGQMTYRVTDPKKLSQLMNFTLANHARDYDSEDPQKLAQRLIAHAQVLTRTALKNLPLREALGKSDHLEETLRQGLRAAELVQSLGLEIIGLAILAIKPKPETSRALEAEAREQILGQADEAVYARRNAAVEQERAIKENELSTEIAVESKKRQIREAQMDAELAVQRKQHEMAQAAMAAKIELERHNEQLVALASANARQEAEAKAYALSATMTALAQSDPRTIQALAAVGMDASQLVALAFRDLAGNAEKIGELNISPDLLRELMAKQKPRP